MAYASLSDIQNEFKSVTFSSGSAPTDSAVTAFIAQEEAKLNARVGLKYVVPVDPTASPLSTLILRSISVHLVTARIKEILKVKAADPKADQDARGGDPKKHALTVIDKIVSGEMPLPDAVLVSTANGVRSFVVDNSEVQVFTKDNDLW